MAGSITIVPNGVLLLSGKGAHFKDTTFIGGAIICASSDFRGSFQGCTFNACTLYIVHGAAAALSDCAWRGCPAALIAHGRATTATLTACSFHAGHFCVIAEAGASAALQASELLGATTTAIIANDPCSHISTDDCTLIGPGSQDTGTPFTTTVGTWLRMHGGTARLRACHVADFPRPAVAAGATASLEVCESSIRCAEACTLVDGARGTISDVHFRGQGPPDATALRLDCGPLGGSRGAARLQMTRCDMLTPDGVALRVSEGGGAALLLCELRCCSCVVVRDCRSRAVVAGCNARGHNICYHVCSSGAALQVVGGKVEAAGSACVAIDKATVAAAGVCFQGGELRRPGGDRPHEAVLVGVGARGRFLRCRIPGGYTGMHVNSGRVRVKDSHVANMTAAVTEPTQKRPDTGPSDPAQIFVDPPTAYTCTGGEVDIEGGSVENCMFGVTTSPVPHQSEPSTVVRMHGVVLKGYSRAVQVQVAVRADITECRFEGHADVRAANRVSLAALHLDRGGAALEGGIALREVRSVLLRGCSFRDHAQDFLVSRGVSAKIADCVFEAAAAEGRGSCVITAADVSVEGCRFSDAAAAVIAHGPVATCAARRCTVGAGVKEAFVANGGASMSVVECEVHATSHGLVVDDGGKLAAQDCECTAGTAALVVGHGGGALNAKRVKAHGGRMAAAARAPGSADLKLVSCELSGDVMAVQVGGAQNKASLLRCTVSAEGVGVVVGNGATARLRDSQISRCAIGIKAGEFSWECDQPCGFCGRSGPVALKHAWDALLARGATHRRGARCAHEGAQARVTLEEVQLRDCSDTAVFVSKHAVLTARRVHVAGCPLGFHVERAVSAAGSVFSECKVVGVAGGEATRGLVCHGPYEGDLGQHEELRGVEVAVA